MLFNKGDLAALGLFSLVYISWGLTDSIQVLIIYNKNVLRVDIHIGIFKIYQKYSNYILGTILSNQS